jgi:excisionase family DNA binding protein
MQAYATHETRTPAAQQRISAAHRSHSMLDPGVLDQLLSELAERIADRLAAHLAGPERQKVDAWLDSRHAAEYLGIGRDSLRRLAAERSIPAEQAGTRCKLYFRRSDLDAWRCRPTGPIEPLRVRRHG